MAQSLYVKEVMESMGWMDGTYIPIANEENKKVMESVNNLLRERNDKTAVFQISDERLDKLRGHYKNAEQDIEQNLKLLNAHRSQLTAESHMLKLAEHDDSRLKQQLKEIEKEKHERQKYEDNTDKEIKKLTKNIEGLSEKIEWAKLALAEWRQAMAKGDEVNKMIEKFCKEDEGRATCLESRRRMLQDTIIKQRKILIESYEEQKSLEQELNRTADLYRQAHQERRHLVSTWKDAVNQMNQREKDIEISEIELEQTKLDCIEKARELKENDEFLNELKENNKEVELKISELNEEISASKKRLQDISDLVSLRENEVSVNRKMLQGLSQKVEQQRRRNRQILLDKEEKEMQILGAEKEYEALQKRSQKFISKTMSAQERLQQLEELIAIEEKSQQQANQELNRLNGILYRAQQQLVKLKDEEKLLGAQNKGIEVCIQSVRNGIKESEKQLQKQIEIGYNTGFKVQMLEMRIDKLDGRHAKEDVFKMQRLMNLEKEAEAGLKEINMLQNQINKIEDDMKKFTCSYNRDMNEIEKMNYKIKEAHLYCEGGEKQLKATTQQNQERIVELSILKMRTHEMEKRIEKHDNKAYNLEKHRMELEKSIKERLIDIKSQLDLLLMKRKHLLEERSALRADLGERHIKIDALKKRYALSVELLGKNDDGTVVTTTQLKIEAAQEKQMLLQEGNELNEKVLKAENDIKAMENTLCLINFSNDSYKKTFEKLDDENPEYIELKSHQENYCHALQRMRTIQSNINLRLQNIEEGDQRRQFLEKEMEDKIRIRLDHKEILMKVYKELMDQKTKLQRAERELKLAQKAIHQKCFGHEYLNLIEKDLNLRELEEKNTTALQSIADLVDMNSELAPEISRLLYEKGLKVPQIRRTKSQGTWRSECSDMSGETNMRMFTSSDRESLSSPSNSSQSSSPTVCSSSLHCKMTGSACPSIVSIDFPINDRVTPCSTAKSTKTSISSAASTVAKKSKAAKAFEK